MALVFIHSDEIIFTRYFDKANGRLVKTVTDNKSEIREEGEIIVSGIRFPRKAHQPVARRTGSHDHLR